VLLLLALYVLWRRQTLVGNKALWISSGCPACGERELVRVSRHFGDRFYNLAAVPAYRYACRNCTWRGLRVGRREQSLAHEAELEAALLRFDPDARMPPIISAGPDAAGEERSPHADSAFRDSGDIEWSETATLVPDDEADDVENYDADVDDEPANNHAGDELPDDMEWLWVRPSGTDQV
jgi:predicted  nucleic acid-binding Zn-ribbon protein